MQRAIVPHIRELMAIFPAVAILGPRQAGKTTLALQLASVIDPKPLYLDLEDENDLARLVNARAYLDAHQDRLLIIDEVQRRPDLFPTLRGVIDARRRMGLDHQQFLILGSASLDLLRQSSESLAGRIAYVELPGFLLGELESVADMEKLWLRGGFPNSYLAKSSAASFLWRKNFIRTYLERDIPELAPSISVATMRQLWTMLAHNQGQLLNYSRLAGGLAVSMPTVRHYIDSLEQLFLVRRLSPYHANLGKRLAKTPKTYIRDSGVLHTLLDLETLADIMGHPVYGFSWEGWVIEQIAAVLPMSWQPFFYRTHAGAEIDLLLVPPSAPKIALEIKRNLAPSLSKGFVQACDDLGIAERYLIYPGDSSYPIRHGVTVMPLPEFLARFNKPA